MKAAARIRKSGALPMMFPHTLSLVQLVPGEYDPLEDETFEEITLVQNWPCSIQHVTQLDGKGGRLGSVIQNEFMILCPCIDIDPQGGHFRLTVNINGRHYSCEGTEIQQIENQYIYDLNNYRIGCHIQVKVNASNWLLGGGSSVSSGGSSSESGGGGGSDPLEDDYDPLGDD